MKKRILFTAVSILLAMGLCIAKLVEIQLVKTKDYSKHGINLLEKSVQQRIDEISLDDGRGGFLDRNGKPISYQERAVLVMFPFVRHLDWPKEELAAIVGLDVRQLEQKLQKADEPFILEDKKIFELSDSQIKEINDLHIPGIIAVKKRFAEDRAMAGHLLGTLTLDKEVIDSAHTAGQDFDSTDYRTKVGSSGLEKAFQLFLKGNGSKRLLYHKAANGLPLFGVDVRYLDTSGTGERVNIQTTIDRDIQRLAEETAKNHHMKKGGIVILDIQTNDLLAMVSMPEQNDKDIHAQGNMNQMLLPQTPGSIFKTVIAAAAMEEGIPLEGRIFNGNLDHLGREVDGQTGRRLGEVTFEQGFALSSNQVFGVLGKELAEKDPEMIERYAGKLGLIDLNGWTGSVFRTPVLHQLPEERKGTVWKDTAMKEDPNYVANTSIGQLDVKVTPLAAANMMATIARGGERMMVRAALKAVDDNGLTIAHFKQQPGQKNVVSSVTAAKLQSLLRGVVTEEGPLATAGMLRSAKYEVAGKSGTAEVGEKESKLYNKWFAGYFPFREPKYAMVVVNLETGGQSASISSLYLEIVNGIYQIHTDGENNLQKIE
ncbi:peptidoglycan D,D-transpeptidase FtsI family protein [Gracilibacillus sp. Marseille-QA3620]